MDSKKRAASMSNEVLNVIKERRSIQTYKADAIPEDILNTILEAGTFAPTGGGKQSPDYCCDHIATIQKKDCGTECRSYGSRK